MIERHWKGTAKPGEDKNYISHLLEDTFPQLSAMKGFVRASILNRPVDGGTEFLIVTVWESIEAIKQFAGETPETAVVPYVVQQMMVGYDNTALHYEVAANYFDEAGR